jgi:hypothetical protein
VITTVELHWRLTQLTQCYGIWNPDRTSENEHSLILAGNALAEFIRLTCSQKKTVRAHYQDGRICSIRSAGEFRLKSLAIMYSGVPADVDQAPPTDKKCLVIFIERFEVSDV